MRHANASVGLEKEMRPVLGDRHVGAIMFLPTFDVLPDVLCCRQTFVDLPCVSINVRRSPTHTI